MTDYLDLNSEPAFLKPPKLAAPSLPAVLKGDCEVTPQPVVLEH